MQLVQNQHSDNTKWSQYLIQFALKQAKESDKNSHVGLLSENKDYIKETLVFEDVNLDKAYKFLRYGFIFVSYNSKTKN